MKSCLVTVGVFLFLAVLVIGAAALAAHESDPATHALRLQQVEEARQAAARSDAFWRAVMPAQTVAYSVAVIALPVAGVVALGGLGLLAWSMARDRRRLVYAKNGVLPVSLDQVVNGATLPLAAAALAAHHETERTRAANPPMMPATVGGNLHLNYAPRQLVGRSSATNAVPALAAPETAPVLQPAPAFSTLVAQGATGAGRILMGLTADGGRLYTNPYGLLSCAVLGVPGSGKTRSAALLVGQAAAYCGVKVALLDPHAGSAESLTALLDPLAAAFWRDPVSTMQDARRLVGELIGELDRRIQGAPAFPMLVAVDEFSGYMRADNGSLATDLERLVLEGRKYRLTAVLLGQSWVVGRSGGSTLRDSLNSAVLHKSKPQTARALIPDVGKQTLALAPGQALFARATDVEPLPIAVPLFVEQDARELARLLPPPVETYPSTKQDRPAAAAPKVGQTPTEPPAPVPVPPAPANGNEDAERDNVIEFTPRSATATSTSTGADGRAARIRDLARQGYSANRISQEVFGHKSAKTMSEIRAALGSEAL